MARRESIGGLPGLEGGLAEAMEGLRPLERTTLFRQATELIRRAIVEGVLAPGEQVSVRELSRRVHVSVTPIREALIHLSAVGLVEFLPGKVRIAAPTPQALSDAFDLREALEGMGARLAAMRRTDEEAQEIAALAEKTMIAARAGNQAEFTRCDGLFHRAIGKASRSSQVERYLSNALDLALTLRNLRRYGHVFSASSSHIHGEIAEAIARRDPDGAEQASRRHVRSVCERLLRYRDERPTDQELPGDARDAGRPNTGNLWLR